MQPPLPGFVQARISLKPSASATELTASCPECRVRSGRVASGAEARGLIEEHAGGDGVEDLYAMYLRSAERWGDATTGLDRSSS